MATAETIGKNKKDSTDDIISDSIAKQNSWLSNRRVYSRRVLKDMNTYAKPNEKKSNDKTDDNDKHILSEYWFPILCAFIIIIITIFIGFGFIKCPQHNIIPKTTETISEHYVNEDVSVDVPTFDIVRIQDDGKITVAGRWLANKNISILLNKKIIATESTDNNGEFVYAPSHKLQPGNYTLSLLGTDPKIKSENKVFLYISEQGGENSVSLLMTSDGSRVLQAPTIITDGDLSVSKIDYLSNGRIVVSGNALPRLRVSLSLNDEHLGWAHVSDYKHFGFGADVGELISGKEYNLAIKMHDGDGNVIAQVEHNFIMPKMTGDDDTFYTVRRGDCLWIIARNFMRRGVLFSMIAQRNNITNPDLIFPKQKLQIPIINKR